MANQAQLVRAVIGAASALDAEWRASPAGRDDLESYLPYMPFSWPDFIALVAEALPETTGDLFLDIGCGPGSKMLLAEAVFGLTVRGIERVSEYVAAARARGLVVAEVNALDWGGYGHHDLVFFNRVFADQALEAQLEEQIWKALRPGAVVIAVNMVAPPPLDWWLVLDDSEVRRWIVRKP